MLGVECVYTVGYCSAAVETTMSDNEVDDTVFKSCERMCSLLSCATMVGVEASHEVYHPLSEYQRHP